MRQKIRLLLISLASFSPSFVLTKPVFAARIAPPPEFTNLEGINFATALSAIIRLLLMVAIIASLIFLLIGGIRWIASGGDKAAAESARGTLTAAIIGLILVLLTWGILWTIGALFSIDILKADFKIPSLVTGK